MKKRRHLPTTFGYNSHQGSKLPETPVWTEGRDEGLAFSGKEKLSRAEQCTENVRMCENVRDQNAK